MEPRRRFKKRYFVVAGLLLLIALVGSVVWQAVTAKPGPLVNYHQRLYDLSAGVQGGGPDEWAEFEEALAAAIRLARSAENYNVNAITALYDREQSDPQHAELQDQGREVIDACARTGAFAQTARFAAIGTAIRPTGEGPLHLVMLPYLGESRQIARIQAARMRRSAERADWDEYIAALEETLAVVRIVGSQTTLIDYLVAIAIEALVVGELRHDIASGAIDDPAVLDRLLAVMDRQRPPTMAHALEGERLFQLDIIQRVYTDDGEGDGRLILTRVAELGALGASPAPAALAQYSIINVAGPLFPSRARTEADLNRLFDAVVADAGVPAHERTGAFDAERFVASLPRRQIVLRILTPAIATAHRSGDRFSTMRAGTELLLRIEHHRLRTGHPPADLPRLAASDPEAPVIDPMTGEPFLYRRLTGDPWGRDYLLYAAGADRRDDGGTIHEGFAGQAFNPDGAGTDYIFNPPPEP